MRKDGSQILSEDRGMNILIDRIDDDTQPVFNGKAQLNVRMNFLSGLAQMVKRLKECNRKRSGVE